MAEAAEILHRAMRSALALLLAGSYATVALPLNLDPATYSEPDDRTYWGDGTVERVRSDEFSQEAFDHRILDGRVFVVEDAGRDWPMAKWDCDYFRKDPKLSKAEMNVQYAQGGDSGFVGFKSNWLEDRRSSGAKDKNAPQVAPYYWGIKDVQYADAPNSKTWKKSMLKKVQEHIRLPSFMSKGNERNFNTTPEFWFAGAGAGAKAHMDSHVQATMSLQLAGTKRWRLGMMDARQAPFLAMIYRDGDVYEREYPWAPQVNVTLHQGEALFFPPGFIHETLNVDDGCAASVTFQFTLPMASRMYRRFLPRIRRTADIHEAWPLIAEWAALHTRTPKEGMPYSEAKMQALGKEGVGAAFQRADRDANNELSYTELHAAFRQEATNVMGFHDLDEDGKITRAEFAEVFAFWAGTVKAALEDTPAKFRKFQLQDMEGDFNIEDLPRHITTSSLKASQKLELKRAATGRGEL